MQTCLLTPLLFVILCIHDVYASFVDMMTLYSDDIVFFPFITPHFNLGFSTHSNLLSSTRSCRDQSDYQEFSGSGSADDEYLPIRRRSAKLNMTRLDPPPHRPNPRAWMDEARSRDSFTSRSGTRKLTVYVVAFVVCV